MHFIFGFVSGFFASLLANYLSPPFRRIFDSLFSWVFHIIDPDRFDLTGKWEQHFQELNPPELKELREVREKVILKHVGTIVTGKGTTDIDPRNFTYRLTVQHNQVFGSYVKAGERGSISGSGMIQLIVSPDRLGMEGQSTWFDRDTEKIESSKSVWKKIA